MKLIYITAKRYPGGTADHNYIENLARAFYSRLRKDFTFIVHNTDNSALPNLPLERVSIPLYIKRTFFFFFWIPWYWYRKARKDKNTIFFSNDQNLLCILIIWKNIFCLQYKVAIDWHMLSETWKDKFIALYSDY